MELVLKQLKFILKVQSGSMSTSLLLVKKTEQDVIMGGIFHWTF